MKIRLPSRWVIPVSVGVLILLVGVAFAVFGTTSTPKAYPEKPSTLTNETVTNYATNYEEVSISNRIDGAQTRVACNGTVNDKIERNFYVITVCEATGERGHSVLDLPRLVAVYLVNDTETTRVSKFGTSKLQVFRRNRIYNATGTKAAIAANSRSASLRVYNFDSRRANATIEVKYVGSPTNSSINTTYTIPPKEGIVETDYTVPVGEYRVTVESRAGEKTTYNWELEGHLSKDLIVYLTPSGNIVVSTIKL